MKIFGSVNPALFNDDGMPVVDDRGRRYSLAAAGERVDADELVFAPRPEFTPELAHPFNPVLEAFRLTFYPHEPLTAVQWVHYLAYEPDPDFAEHATRVIDRFLTFFAEEIEVKRRTFAAAPLSILPRIGSSTAEKG